MIKNNIIGTSKAISFLKDQIKKVSKVNYSLLITGESGSGKELVARSVHFSGDRSEYPFIPVNAATIPGNLLETELFGYVKGAFTDASGNRKGLIEEANGGTLFLDEISELPIELQSKLLRVIQERELKRVGENCYRKIDIRLICATNRDLEDMIVAGLFREDLFYRIQDLIINVPPLRERLEDIPVLIDHFIKKHNFIFEEDDIDQLKIECVQKDWKGNVRELESFLKRVFTYYPERIPFSKEKEVKHDEGLLALRDHFEQSIIKRSLIKNGWNKSRSARDLKISRAYLFTLIKKYRLNDSY